MPGRIDVHAHLLPGLDDGCSTIEDSLACGRLFALAGYTHLCCTPHIWPQFPANQPAFIRQRTAQLQQAFRSAAIPLTLIPGGEINLEWNWPAIQDWPNDQIPTYAFAGKYLLFDFWAEIFPEFLIPAIRHLQDRGFALIMAHPERIKAFHREPAQLARIEKMGVLLQGNSWCLLDSPGSPIRALAELLLREGRYFLLGTDTHVSKSLPVRLAGINRAAEIMGEAYIAELTFGNPQKLFPPGACAEFRL